MPYFQLPKVTHQWQTFSGRHYRAVTRHVARLSLKMAEAARVWPPEKNSIPLPAIQGARAASGQERPAPAAAGDQRSKRRIAMLRRSGLFGQDTCGATIERACSLADLEGAYRLVHDVYVEAQYIHRELSGLRVRMFEALPEEATFVAKVDGRIVGVVSVAVDSTALGLPSDVSFKAELDALRAGGSKLSEMTNQAISEKYRKSAVATELMRCAGAHVYQAGYDETIATISPNHSAFYRILGFREIGSARSYSAAVYDPVIALSLDINQYRCPVSELDEARRFIRHFLHEGNPFMERVVKWNREAETQFRDANLLRRLFISETGFITHCSDAELRFLERAWGRRLFASATGRSLLARTKNWTSALLDVLNIHDDSHPNLRRCSQPDR